MPEGQMLDLVGYVRERQAATNRRRAGAPRPWSSDPVIADKFLCSVIRDDDRTSTEARKIILGLPEDQRLGAALGFRLCNRAETYAALAEAGVFASGSEAEAQRVFASVSPAISTVYKINVKGGLKNIPEIARMVAAAVRLARRGDFRIRDAAMYTTQAVRGLVGSGPFVSYQTMQDLRWLRGTPYTDEDSWCLLGIGAMRGLARSIGQYSAAGWLERDNEQRDDIEKALGFSVAGRGDPAALEPLPGKALKMMEPILGEMHAALGPHVNLFEVEHNLCEWGKYCRIWTGESKGRKFTPKD